MLHKLVLYFGTDSIRESQKEEGEEGGEEKKKREIYS